MPYSKETSALWRILESRPVAYHPQLARIVGDVKAAIYLSQLLYWHGKQADPDGWIFKTVAEMEEETALSEREQERARSILKEKGCIEAKRAGLPAMPAYRVLHNNIIELANKIGQNVLSSEDVSSGVKIGQNVLSYQSETTTETTSREYDSATRRPRPPLEAPEPLKSQPKPPRKKAEYLSWDCVKAYLDATGRKWTDRLTAEQINEHVSDSIKWAGVVTEWVGKGYSPVNVAGMIDVYYNGWRETKPKVDNTISSKDAEVARLFREAREGKRPPSIWAKFGLQDPGAQQ